uniref:Solute carrier family 4 member 10 n=1 Tax=Sinocyclocheilus grahami TaxID=75366 RepID=A0A672P8U2_SINGR
MLLAAYFSHVTFSTELGSLLKSLKCCVTDTPSQRVQFLLGTEDGDEEHIPHDLFTELDEICLRDGEDAEWRETARWLKFEEDVEDGGERWSKPYVATLSLHSLFELRSCITNGTVMLDMRASSLEEIADMVLDQQEVAVQLEDDVRKKVKEALLKQHHHQNQKKLANRIPIVRSFADIGKRQSETNCIDKNGIHLPLCRKYRRLQMIPPQSQPLTTEGKNDVSRENSAVDFSKIDLHFMKKIPPGAEASNVLVGELEFLDRPIVAFVRLSPAVLLNGLAEVPITTRFLFILLGPLGKGPQYHEIGRSIATLMTDEEKRKIPAVPNGELAETEEHGGHGGPELQRTGRLFGGLVLDVKRKAPHFLSDFTDALSLQCLASFLFLYCACMSPVITFGGLLGEATEGRISAIESLFGASMTGIAYSLFAGQPLTILGSTGPVLVFEKILFKFCKYLDYISSLTRYFSFSFQDCIEKKGEFVGSACGPHGPYVPDVLFWSIVLFFSTVAMSAFLKEFKTSRYFPTKVRAIISDFAVFITIFTMVLVDYVLGVPSPKLKVPNVFKPTRDDRGWFINPLGPNPWWTCVITVVPALLCTILIFMDQQITAVIINRKEHKLKKGCGYHLDLFIVGVMLGVCSLMGLPWFVAATVLSISHVNSLKLESECSAPGEQPKFLGIREQRVTGLMIFLLMGCSVFMTSVLKFIPMPVLYGVFLYMGASSLRGIQFFDRLRLFGMPAKHQPDFIYLRHVPLRKVHLFTIIQLSCLVLLWVIKTSRAAIVFPMMVLALVFIRKLLDFIFTKRDLSWLDDLMPESKKKKLEDAEREVSFTIYYLNRTLTVNKHL